MLYLLFVIVGVIGSGLNTSLYVINEEFIIFFSLTLFFIILFKFLKKGVNLFFYQEARGIYLIYYYLFEINVKLLLRLEHYFFFYAIRCILVF
jgi:hypothetical protein